MQRVLVTGANGFVGSHLVKELSENGHEVVGISGPQGSPDKSPYVQECISLDLNDSEAVQKINFGDITGVVHLAGLAAVGPSFDNPMQYISTNMGIEVNLFEAARTQGAKPRFLIISSGALYDPKAPLPLDESSSVVPSSPYAVSKLGQEQLAQYYSMRGFECIVARPFNHIGPGQNLGFIVPDITKQVVAFDKTGSGKVTVGNLDAKRDYTDVRDIARAYRLLLEKGTPGETYNICTSIALSGHEILAQILKSVGVNPEIAQDPAKMRPSDAPEIYGNHRKLTNDTGWQPKISFETTIQDVVADWRGRI